MVRSLAGRLRGLAASGVARLFGTVTAFRTTENVAALTFDDGPHPEFTPRLLDILDRHGARATFFWVGSHVDRHPELIRRAVSAGHAVANHTWSHVSLAHARRGERLAQIRRCSRTLEPHGADLLRPPYGDQTLLSHLDVRREGLDVIGWSVVGKDWLDHDSDWLYRRLADRTDRGSVVLLHDRLHDAEERRYFDRQPTLDAVDSFLEREGTSFQFRTIPDLLQSARPIRRNWYRTSDPGWLSDLVEPPPEAGEP